MKDQGAERVRLDPARGFPVGRAQPTEVGFVNSDRDLNPGMSRVLSVARVSTHQLQSDARKSGIQIPVWVYKVRPIRASFHGLGSWESTLLPTSCVHVYVHFIWRTWDSTPLITPEFRDELYASIAQARIDVKCQAIEIGGIEDHVHALVRMHATTSVADAAKQMKGASSHLVTHVLKRDDFFKWQGSYGAFSVNPRELPVVIAYIKNQQTHHANGTIEPQWERYSEEDAE